MDPPRAPTQPVIQALSKVKTIHRCSMSDLKDSPEFCILLHKINLCFSKKKTVPFKLVTTRLLTPCSSPAPHHLVEVMRFLISSVDVLPVAGLSCNRPGGGWLGGGLGNLQEGGSQARRSQQGTHIREPWNVPMGAGSIQKLPGANLTAGMAPPVATGLCL